MDQQLLDQIKASTMTLEEAGAREALDEAAVVAPVVHAHHLHAGDGHIPRKKSLC